MNSKSKTNDTPPALASADVLAQFTRLHAILTETHATIPKLLATERSVTHELGLAESRSDPEAGRLRQQFSATVEQRQAAVRARAASIEALLGLEAGLQSDRAELETERQQVVSQVAGEFAQRWARACGVLNELRAEAQALGRALRCTIPCPAPAAGPGIAAPEPQLPAHLTALVRRLDSLDSALARVSAIRQAKVMDARHYDLCRVRGTPPEYPGVYLVTGTFDSLIDGLKFEAGALVDSTVVGPGSLARLATARRYLRPADLVA